ncbi:hypothetical protein KKF84_17565, partial [Myxococcota bacterium]|nr:hypothetical protein [Myxococcota bacterium]
MKPLKQYKKEASLKAWREYLPKKKAFKLYVKLKDYQFSLGKWVSIKGLVSGGLTVIVKNTKFSDYTSLLPSLLSAEGNLTFKRLEIPFYGAIHNIKITLYPSPSGETLFHGSLGSTLMLSGQVASGKLKGKAVFRGVDLAGRLPAPWSRLISAKANGRVDFSLEPKLRSAISLDSMLAVLSKRGRNGEYLVLRNKGPVELQYFGGKIAMKRGIFTLGSSILRLKGFATKKQVAFSFHGTGDIATLSPWIPGPVSRFRGPFVFDGSVKGSYKNP